MTEMPKDTLSVNELDSLNRLGLALQEFLVDWESDDELSIKGVTVYVGDHKSKRSGQLTWGTFTLWPGDDDIKFEPGYVPELMGVE